jgi:hypothetical protein
MPQQKGMATAWERGGLVGDDAAVGYSQIDSKNKPHPRVGQLAAARKRLEDLETIADWREDLLRRIRQRQLIFELVTIGGEQDSLRAEVETFKRCCRALAWPARSAA